MKIFGKHKNLTHAVVDAAKGDTSKVDMSVGDIYGSAYEGIGLPADLVASSFGRVKDMSLEELASLNKADVARSMLIMVILNSLTIARLTAKSQELNRVIIMGMHIEAPEIM